ncbi:alpha/beta hydrolase [Subtercola lobariae]|uniref:Alpha/beta hydrolase fold-3 domain-containing protein n=1 Tax=Subtercola lobariae TaxID=1588641 RepID=A0A917BJ65_9MICO|nr:alpha/beta hydrolase [Subtercola lobariae]GGF41722.1 hypothetical protein GCM10011399_38020 [Subtercola lobariae]
MSTYALDDELVAAAAALPTFDRADVAEARRIYASRFAAAAGPASSASTSDATGSESADRDGVTIERRSVAAVDGWMIALRIYRPQTRTNRAAVYHVHGGGFMMGDLEMSDHRNREIATEVGSIVVSVDYRLAPEWPFPTPLDDVFAGLVWVHEHADDLDIDPASIVLHGVSAGGALVAATALLARDRGGPPVAFQFLASPVLDDRLTSDSSRRFTDTPALTRHDIEVCWSLYLHGRFEGVDGAVATSWRENAETPAPYAAPARASDLRGLPSTYISVAEFDPLRDDGIAYADALLAAGIPTELHLFPGTYHGSSVIREPAISRRERLEEIHVLRRAANPTRRPIEGEEPHA